MKKLLITGASGFLGWNLCHHKQQDWQVYGTFNRHKISLPDGLHARVDLTDFRELKDSVQRVCPDAIVHTAAIADANWCEQHPGATEKINVTAAINLAGMCADRRIPFVFTSTDMVFDGRNPPYDENAPISPVSVYGEQKVRAEIGIQERCPEGIICRMPLMFGDPGPAAANFFRHLLCALNEKKEIKAFIDEYRTPISAHTAAAGLYLMLDKVPPGIIHLGGSERISRHEFAVKVAAAFACRDPRIIACRQQDVPMPAARPPDISLTNAKAMALGFKPSSLNDQLQALKSRV